jgi:[protein-PII] uridylyltransferase
VRPSFDSDLTREAFLSQIKTYHRRLKERLPDPNAPRNGGLSYVREYSRTVDEIVDLVYRRAIMNRGFSAPGQVDIAVIGMGGYGRGELAPSSDIDILILCKRKTKAVKETAASFIRLMWDVGFEIGHSMQSLVESESVLVRNLDAKTALIESRWVCGSAEMGRAIGARILRIRRTDRERFLRRKIKDAITRHKKYGFSYQLVEPNLKLSPGGLRDFQTLTWLGMVLHTPDASGLAALRRMKLLQHGEIRALKEAYDFLLKTRIHLHLIAGSRQDQLTVHMQRKLTKQLGYGSSGDHLGVELFMKDYYMHTRTVFHIIEDIMDELAHGKDVGVLLGQGKNRRERRVLAMRVDRERFRNDPLQAFKRQQEVGLKLDRTLKRRLEELLNSELTSGTDTRRMRTQFTRLFERDTNLSRVLRSMHETGFLGRIVPEFNKLTCLKRHDLYHHYTADEHSFRVIRSLEELAEPTRSRSNPLVRIYTEIPGKHLLFLAALLHDIGKIEGRGHAKKGAALARTILKRLGAKPEEVYFISFLIENHLLMSHYSQRRDPTDIGTLQSFCSKVRNRNNLKFLCLITYADLKATSPHVWTKWKENLLWGLYLKANHYLARKAKKPDETYKARKRELLRAFPAGPRRESALAHLDLLPGRYLLVMSGSQVKRHMELIDRLDGAPGIASLRQGKLFTEMTFCTYDKPFRLAQLCGILTVNDLNILSAFAFTRSDGKVIDIFQVENLLTDTPVDDERLAKIQNDLAAVLGGREDINDIYERHIARWRRQKNTAIPVPLRMEFESDVSDDFTIIDIFAQDEPGLLFRISRALSEAGLTIYRARISTEANRAIDAFYVQDRHGKKIRSARLIQKIRDVLQNNLPA